MKSDRAIRSARIAVIGGGIAGASIAAELVAPGDGAEVILIEAEEQPGHHATGRSAAFWSETYGGPLIQPLTRASEAFLRAPPLSFSARGFLAPRGAIHLARAGAEAELDAIERAFAGAGVGLERLSGQALRAAIPGIKGAWTQGLAEPGCRDIDVAALHAAYLAAFRRGGGQIVTGARVEAVERRGAGFELAAGLRRVECDIVANAAGAWADGVAGLAGATPMGLTPHRRTMVQLRVDPPVRPELPLVIDAGGGFYFKGESGGRIWLSPHDETASAACDAAPEDVDVAVAIARLGEVVDWRAGRVERSWAGLRTFAPDRLPVYGWDPDVDGLFWFAGQGGFGIQTAPAAAKLGGALLLGATPDGSVAGIDPAPFAPRRRRPDPLAAKDEKAGPP